MLLSRACPALEFWFRPVSLSPGSLVVFPGLCAQSLLIFRGRDFGVRVRGAGRLFVCVRAAGYLHPPRRAPSATDGVAGSAVAATVAAGDRGGGPAATRAATAGSATDGVASSAVAATVAASFSYARCGRKYITANMPSSIIISPMIGFHSTGASPFWGVLRPGDPMSIVNNIAMSHWHASLRCHIGLVIVEKIQECHAFSGGTSALVDQQMSN